LVPEIVSIEGDLVHETQHIIGHQLFLVKRATNRISAVQKQELLSEGSCPLYDCSLAGKTTRNLPFSAMYRENF